MICELYKFFGLLPLDYNDFEFAQTIRFEPEDLTVFQECVEFFVECEFQVQNPAGLTTIERYQYFLAKIKFRIKNQKYNALINREIATIPEGVDVKELFKEVTPQQKALDIMTKWAVGK